MSTAIIIQARMGSARFPGKSLADLGGKTVIQRVVEACRRADVGSVIVATSCASDCDPLVNHLFSLGVPFQRGDELDVLKRYADIVRHSAYSTVVRVTGDCPLVDHRTIKLLVDAFHARPPGYSYLGCANSPDGNDVEVFSASELADADRLATDPLDREHVTRWMRSRPSRMPCPEPAYDVRYSVDTPEDLELCKRLVKSYGEHAPWDVYVSALKAWK